MKGSKEWRLLDLVVSGRCGGTRAMGLGRQGLWVCIIDGIVLWRALIPRSIRTIAARTEWSCLPVRCSSLRESGVLMVMMLSMKLRSEEDCALPRLRASRTMAPPRRRLRSPSQQLLDISPRAWCRKMCNSEQEKSRFAPRRS